MSSFSIFVTLLVVCSIQSLSSTLQNMFCATLTSQTTESEKYLFKRSGSHTLQFLLGKMGIAHPMVSIQGNKQPSQWTCIKKPCHTDIASPHHSLGKPFERVYLKGGIFQAYIFCIYQTTRSCHALKSHFQQHIRHMKRPTNA